MISTPLPCFHFEYNLRHINYIVYKQVGVFYNIMVRYSVATILKLTTEYTGFSECSVNFTLCVICH